MKQKKAKPTDGQIISCRILISKDKKVATVLLSAKEAMTTQDIVWALHQFITPRDEAEPN